MPTEQAADALCPRCGVAMAAKVMRTAIWQGDRVAIVEDVPALVCDKCNEQFYDETVSDALRRLAEDGFPAHAATSEVVVPVFSLKERIREPKQMPEDAYVD